VTGVPLPAEHFPPLNAVPDLAHGFTLRVRGLEMSHDKAEALARLDSIHREIRSGHRVGKMPFVTAQQVHGKQIAVINSALTSDRCFQDCDGIVTNQRGVCLGIYVADCCAVYIVDPARRALGLVHSGKKGTELGIAANAIEMMTAQFGSSPTELIVQLSPCIRPPHYEIDFAAEIIRQCRAAGVTAIHDSGTCTACDLEHYYSYRAEKGRTGRMLAFLALC
jgi:polyphenol oxidase